MELWFFIAVVGIAIVALIVNLRVKVPKKFFTALVVLLVVFTAMIAMTPERSHPDRAVEPPVLVTAPRIDGEAVEISQGELNFAYGENKFSLPAGKIVGGDKALLSLHFPNSEDMRRAMSMDFALVNDTGAHVLNEGMQVLEGENSLRLFFILPAEQGSFSELTVSSKEGGTVLCDKIDVKVFHTKLDG